MVFLALPPSKANTGSKLAKLPTTEFRILLRSSDLECGSSAAAFLSDSRRSILGAAQKAASAVAYLVEIKKQIEENKSLRFGSTAFWNTFLQPYRRTRAAKRGETDFLCKFFAWFASE